MSDAGLEVVQVKYGERMVNRSMVLHDYGQYGLPEPSCRWSATSGSSATGRR